MQHFTTCAVGDGDETSSTVNINQRHGVTVNKSNINNGHVFSKIYVKGVGRSDYCKEHNKVLLFLAKFKCGNVLNYLLLQKQHILNFNDFRSKK